jgi:HAD superfamily hydrolase (TIGR01509 family)
LIHNIVFDVGRVFVDLNPRPIIEFLSAHGVDVANIEALCESVTLEDHECGRLDGQALLARMAALARQPVALEHLHAKWIDMFVLQPDMVNLAHRLSQHYRVYLLSNVGDLHWAHLSREYRLHHIGHGVLPSFLAGVMKPHEGIYLEAERRFNLTPAKTVFVDDRPENVSAARARGWHGIVHAGYGPTVSALRALKVDC